MAAPSTPAQRLALSRAVVALRPPLREPDPVRFVRDVLGHDPWAVPEAVMRAVAVPRARVAVKACHASAKTYTAAELVLWWVYAVGGVCISTAPTGTQVKQLLWAEIHKAHDAARRDLPGRLNETELRLAPDVFAIGRSTDQGVRFQGFHGDHVLVILDEAPGVRGDTWEAIEGIRAGGDVRVLALGNPTMVSGPFYDAFTTQRAAWATFTIDAFATPNLAGLSLPDLLALPEDELDANPRPYLATRRWVKECYREWGEASPLWQARVRGQFPAEGDDALISLRWLEAAQGDGLAQPDEPLLAGVDVAGPGESETVVVLRRGWRVEAVRAWADADPRGAVVAYLRAAGVARANVDSVGVGHYFVLALRDAGIEAVPVNVGEAPRDREQFANLKAEHYWGLRQRFQADDVRGLTDEKTVAQLAAIRYEHNARGQVVIEGKEAARRRGVKSPDRAEALMLAFAEEPTFVPVMAEGETEANPWW